MKTSTCRTIQPLLVFIISVAMAKPDLSHGQEYIQFPGIDYADVRDGGQAFTFNSSGHDWNVVVTLDFAVEPPVFANTPFLSTLNVSGIPFNHPTYPDGLGVFLGGRFRENQTAVFQFSFSPSGPGAAPLDLTVFSSESVDLERDTVTTSGSVWANPATGNLTNSNGSPTTVISNGGATISFSDGVGGTGNAGRGFWSADTSLPATGGTITWGYEFLHIGGAGGNNMIGFNNISASVPETSVPGLMLTTTGALALRRKRKG